MQEIEITKKKFNRMKKIKKDAVHYRDNLIYKYSPESWPIMTTIEKFEKEPCFKHIATPKAYLMCEKQYFGYIMEYNKTISKINDAIQNGIITNLDVYILKLLEILENLNQIGIYYWDFHSENILSTQNGEPFILDIDGAEYLPDIEDLHNQREYLTEFLINLYLGTDNLFFIHKPKWSWIGRKYLSRKSQDYIDILGNLSKPAPELPYCIIEDLKDKEKLSLIKKQLNN